MKTAIVVEDQPVIWDYAKSCLEGLCEIKAFCSNTQEAEEAFRISKPDFVWLDCYLGEISETAMGPKNSGILLATWIKKHNPDTKIFLFTASYELNIFEIAQNIGIEGIALGGKFVCDKQIIIDGITEVLAGNTWISQNLIQEFELDELGKMTVFEFCVVCSLLLGKPTSQIAEELDTTRKRVNNAIYRIKDKLMVGHDVSRKELLEILKDKIKNKFSLNEYYKVSDLVSINLMVQKFLTPIIKEIRNGELGRLHLKSLSSQV